MRKAAGALLARPDAPTAIITNSDYTALGIYKTARDLSLRIGPDVSVIGHDDLATSELLDPPLATIRLDGREMGRALMARLLGDGRDDYVAPVELVERASLQAPGYLRPGTPSSLGPPHRPGIRRLTPRLLPRAPFTPRMTCVATVTTVSVT